MVEGASERRPLDGVRVLDLTQFFAGPFCAMVLADLGATVVKVESPDRGDPYRQQGPEFAGGLGSQFIALNCSKKSLAIDFKDPRGLAVLRRLIAASDVFLENSRPGALDKLGLGYEQLRAEFPALIYGSISAYGAHGPRAREGGFDLVLQAESGLMDLTGETDGPPMRVGAPLLDIVAGLLCAVGVLSACVDRERTGRGRHVETSLLQAALASMCTMASGYLAGGPAPRRSGNHSPLFAPYGAFQAADGPIILVGAGNEDLWRRLCSALGVEHLAADPRFVTNSSRVANRAALTAQLEAVLGRRTRQEWASELRAAGVPGGPINTLPEVLADPQACALDLVDRVPHPAEGTVSVVGVPVTLSEMPARHAGGPPGHGEHTRELLLGLGYQEAEIRELESEGVVKA